MLDEISIIIPTLNEVGYIPALLESIKAQTYSGKLELIVVDGHSNDGTLEKVKSFASQLPNLTMLEAKRDIGHQRNVGAEKAKYKNLLFLDADVILPPRLLEKLSAKVKMKKTFVVTVAHTALKMNFFDRLFVVSGYLAWFQSVLMGVAITPGDFLLTTRENHSRIGGFAEGSVMGEDIDYGLRSVASGASYKFYLTPRLIGSLRRPRQMGRLRLLRIWARGFRHVLRSGPVMPGEGYEYQYGNHLKNTK